MAMGLFHVTLTSGYLVRVPKKQHFRNPDTEALGWYWGPTGTPVGVTHWFAVFPQRFSRGRFLSLLTHLGLWDPFPKVQGYGALFFPAFPGIKTSTKWLPFTRGTTWFPRAQPQLRNWFPLLECLTCGNPQEDTFKHPWVPGSQPGHTPTHIQRATTRVSPCFPGNLQRGLFGRHPVARNASNPRGPLRFF